MLDFKEKKRVKKIVYSKITLFVLFVLVILMLKAVFGVYKSARVTAVKKNEAEIVFKNLEDRELSLKEEVSRLSTDKGVEEEIRDKFGMVKEGEKIIMLINDGGEENQEADFLNKKSFWSKIFDF
ncbi:septum formation initiator family protein [Patescibacteria group bacterium]